MPTYEHVLLVKNYSLLLKNWVLLKTTPCISFIFNVHLFFLLSTNIKTYINYNDGFTLGICTQTKMNCLGSKS